MKLVLILKMISQKVLSKVILKISIFKATVVLGPYIVAMLYQSQRKNELAAYVAQSLKALLALFFIALENFPINHECV